MRNGLLLVLILLVVVMGFFIYNYDNRVTVSGEPVPLADQPSALRIPTLHIDASILSVGTTSTGQMDAPVSKAINSPYWTSVFWYQKGAAPGQAGNAVIAGHVDRVGGDPAIFWTLSHLKPGDKLSILTLGQQELHFSVDHVVRYAANASSSDVLGAVFGPTTAHHLNLITCSGVWTGNGYDERLVVFTTQVK